MPHAVHHIMTYGEIRKTMENHQDFAIKYICDFFDDASAFLQVVDYFAQSGPEALYDLLPTVLEVKNSHFFIFITI